MKKRLLKIAVLTLAVAVLFGLGQTEVQASQINQDISIGNIATVSNVEVTVKNASGTPLASYEVSDENIADELQSAMDYIKNLNNSNVSGAPWTIVVPAGEYSIDNTLNVYSNTTLDLSAGVTLVNDCGSTMIRFGRQEDIADGYDVSGYDAYQNIKIIGAKNQYAKLDGNADESALLRFAHASNVTVQYVEFSNVTKAHHAEFAGCKNVTVDSCKFTGFHPLEKDDGTNYEALQLDVLEDYHFPNYPEYDGSVNQNVKITNNVFDGVNRGVGAHSGHVGRYMKNVEISNNTFNNVNGYAIVATNFINSKITNNTIQNAGSGIYFRHISKEYINYYPGESAKVNTNLNTTISNNTISLKETTFDNYKFGIQVYGEKLTKAVTKDGYTIPKGDYRVSNIKIENNTIRSTTFANGIWLQGTMNSSVKNNKITYTISIANKTGDEWDGVKLEASTGNTLSGNKVYDNSAKKVIRYGFDIKDSSNNNTIQLSVVENVAGSGIYVNGSTGCNVSDNEIKNTGEFGVFLNEKASVVITKNEISKSGDNGIFLSKTSKSDLIENNVISNSGLNGIHLKDKSEAVKIQNNKITSSKGQGICLNEKSACTNMELNEIVSAKEQGIYIADGASVAYISTNTIIKPSKCGIFVNVGTVSNILTNKISEAGQSGIGIDGNSTVTTIDNNTVSVAGSHGIYALGNAVCNSVQKNQISSVKEQGIYLGGKAAMKNIIYNTITDSAKCGIYVKGGTVETISNNKIKKNTNKTSAANGIYIAAVAQKIKTISTNNIANVSKVAIGIEGTVTAASIENNEISNAGSHGIYVCGSAKIDKVYKNTIKKSTQQGIYLTGSATMTNITSNTITDSKKCGIYINGGYVTNISKNTINKSKNKTSATNGIYITSVKKQISKIASNKVSNTSKIGIGLDGKMTVKSIEKNTLKSVGSEGIYIAKTSNAKKIYKNSLSSTKGNGIYISSTKASGTISSNTIKKASKYGMDISKSAKITAKDNTITSCKKGQVLIRGSKNKGYNTSSFKIKKISKSKKGVTLKWTKAKNVKSYVVYRSTSKNGTYKKIGTTTKASYTDKKVKKNKTYYYKLVPVAEYSKAKIEFSLTASKKIKFK